MITQEDVLNLLKEPESFRIEKTNRRIVDIISDVNRRTSDRNALIFKSIAEREGGNAKRNMAYSAAA